MRDVPLWLISVRLGFYLFLVRGDRPPTCLRVGNCPHLPFQHLALQPPSRRIAGGAAAPELLSQTPSFQEAIGVHYALRLALCTTRNFPGRQPAVLWHVLAQLQQHLLRTTQRLLEQVQLEAYS